MDELLKLLRDDASLTPAQIAGRLGREKAKWNPGSNLWNPKALFSVIAR